jgi:hypothetical protein
VVNSLPVLSGLSSTNTLEDIVAGPLPFTVEDADSDENDLALSATAGPPGLIDALVLGGASTNRTLTLIPRLNAHGTATVAVTVFDGHHAVTNAFELAIDPVNDAPTATPIADQVADEDQSSAGGLVDHRQSCGFGNVVGPQGVDFELGAKVLFVGFLEGLPVPNRSAMDQGIELSEP